MKHIYVLLAASLGLLAACSDLNETDFIEKDIIDGDLVEQVIFEAPVIRALGDDDETRASLSQEGDNPIRFGWEATDIVGICPNQGTQVAFEMTDGAGTNTASFDGGGWALRKGYTYSCYFPLVEELFLDRSAIPVTFANQVQNGVSSYEGVNFYLASEGTSSSAGTLRFTFQMLNTVIRIKPIGLPAGTYTKLTLTTEDDLFVQEGTFGLEDMEITGKTYSNTLELSLNDVVLTETTTDANPVLFYLTSAPVDLTGKTVVIRVYSEDGSIYRCVKKPTKAYEAGAWGGLKCNMGSPSNVIYYTSTDGEIVVPHTTSGFGANIVSNEYIDGLGILTFDGDVTSIGDYSFRDCSNLSSITIPESVSSIGNSAFFCCFSLASFSGKYATPDGLFLIDQDNLIAAALGSIDESVSIPSYVTSIGGFAFYGCPNLTSIVIPEGVTYIGQYAFRFCTELTSVSFPETLNHIEGYAFHGCSNLTEVSFPENLISFGFYAFTSCSGLSSLTIPASVEYIAHDAFIDCTGLTGITMLSNTPPTVEVRVFDDTNNCPIYVPAESVDVYRSAWSEYADRIQAITVEDPSNQLNSLSFINQGDETEGMVYNCFSYFPKTLRNKDSNSEVQTSYGSKEFVNTSIVAQYRTLPAIADLSFLEVGSSNGLSFVIKDGTAADDFLAIPSFIGYEDGILSIEVNFIGSPGNENPLPQIALCVEREDGEIVTSDYSNVKPEDLGHLAIAIPNQYAKRNLNVNDAHLRRASIGISELDDKAYIYNFPAWASLDDIEATCDVCMAYNSSLNLMTFVSAHRVTEDGFDVETKPGELTSADLEALGLSWAFSVVKNYRIDINGSIADQASFVSLQNGVLTPMVYSSGDTPIGHAPIIRVALKHGTDVVEYAYIKVFISDVDL